MPPIPSAPRRPFVTALKVLLYGGLLGLLALIVAVERDQRPLDALGRIGVDRSVGRALHRRVERGPDVDRIGGLVDQRIELGQRPVGEIADAVLVGGLLDPDVGGIDRRRRNRRG